MGDENSEMVNLDLNLPLTSSPHTELRYESYRSAVNDALKRENARNRTRSMGWSIMQPHTPPYQARNFSTEMLVNLQTGEGSAPSEGRIADVANVDDQIERSRPAIRRVRTRWGPPTRLPRTVPFQAHNLSTELMVNSQTGEGISQLDGRNNDAAKECKKDTVHGGGEKLGKEEEGKGDEGSFYDCCICLDLSSDPVVTPCGHLFCWPCLYRWLNNYSKANECPMCKGEVTIKNLTPIIGCGSFSRKQDRGTSTKIPVRPPARRVQSCRKTIQRNAYTSPIDEMVRPMGSGFIFSRDLVEVQPPAIERVNESPERNRSSLNLILTSSAIRQEQQTAATVPPNEVTEIDLTRNTIEGTYVEDSWVASLLDSESQTLDTTVDTDSRVSHSSSSRINVGSRVSDRGRARDSRRRLN